MRTGSTEDGGDCEGASGGLSFVLEWGKASGGTWCFFVLGWGVDVGGIGLLHKLGMKVMMVFLYKTLCYV